MIRIVKEFEVISRYRQGESYRSIARELGIDRKTVKVICDRYNESMDVLERSRSEQEVEEATEQLVLTRSYDSSNRKTRTFTPEVEVRMKELYQQEGDKNKRLGAHKQALTATAVHEILSEEGHVIGYRTVAHYWRQMKQKTKEAFIRQEYPLGYRVEFDFGEVKLEIAGKVQTYYLAVFACPASQFYWAYLYPNQKQAVFQDAHVQFFEMVGGVYQEVVYDNMRNVVTRFIGHSEKELNQSLIQLSLYYGFEVNVTNCFSGHEKGTVEGRVKHIRRQCFSKTYQFSSTEAARTHLTQRLIQLNQTSQISEEKAHLMTYRPPFELAEMIQCRVTKYSIIQYETNAYSVPDYLVGQTVQLKIYPDYFVVYANHEEVCRHQKIEGSHQYQLDIYHYLKTLMRKPGALKHSLVLKHSPDLKALYDLHYKEKPREFLARLDQCRSLSRDQLIEGLSQNTTSNSSLPLFQEVEAMTEFIEADWQRLNILYGLERVTSEN